VFITGREHCSGIAQMILQEIFVSEEPEIFFAIPSP